MVSLRYWTIEAEKWGIGVSGCPATCLTWKQNVFGHWWRPAAPDTTHEVAGKERLVQNPIEQNKSAPVLHRGQK